MLVTFKIYKNYGESGQTEYKIPTVFSANYPHTEKDTIEHRNVRGKGSIIVDGGNSPWDLTLKGVLTGTDYDDLMSNVDEMESEVEINVPYTLIISSGTTTYVYNVKRITPIITQEDNLRTKMQKYTITFRVNCW